MARAQSRSADKPKPRQSKATKPKPKPSRKPKPAASSSDELVAPVGTVCRKCGSGKHSEPTLTRQLNTTGRLFDGREYSRIGWFHLVCKGCGQARNERVIVPR